MAHLPNHLPADAGISTSGVFQPPFTVLNMFICTQECSATLSIGPFTESVLIPDFKALHDGLGKYSIDISSWQNKS
jgi:hypothetical protein